MKFDAYANVGFYAPSTNPYSSFGSWKSFPIGFTGTMDVESASKGKLSLKLTEPVEKQMVIKEFRTGSSDSQCVNFLPSLDVIDGEVSFCLDLNPHHLQASLFDPWAWVYVNPFQPADVKWYPTVRRERYNTGLGPKWGPLGFTKWVDGQAYVRFKLGGLSKDVELVTIQTPEWECANTGLIAGIIIGFITLFCLIPCCCIYYCHTRKVCKGCSRTCAWCSPCERYKQHQLAKKAAEPSQPSTPALQSV